MATQSFYLALPSTSSGFPTHMSVPSSRTGTAFPIPEHVSADMGSITYNGVTYSVYIITSDTTYYQVSSLTTYGDSWVHSENVSTNRTSVSTYTSNPPASTTVVWTYLGNAKGSTYGLSGATQDKIIFYQYYGTYYPSSGSGGWTAYGGTSVGGAYKKIRPVTSEISLNDVDDTGTSYFNGLSSSTAGTVIIELYQSGLPTTVGAGLITNPSSLGSGVVSERSFLSGIGCYSFYDQAVDIPAYVPNNSVQRKVFALHNVDLSTNYNSYVACLGTSSGGNTNGYVAYGFNAQVPVNTWCTHTAGDGKVYYAISVTQHRTSTTTGIFERSISVTAGNTYAFRLHTYSENNYDGIIVSTTPITTNPSGSFSSNFTGTNILGLCTGYTSTQSNVQSFEYTPVNDGTLYMYYRMDSSGFGPSVQASSGDVELTITEPQSGVTVTLNKNGGTGGTNSVSITTGTTASNYPSIISPTRANSNTNGPNFRFDGYWTATSGGTQYYDAGGYGTRTFNFTTSQTWYAQWYNAISYEPSEGTVSYSSSDQYATVSSVGWTCSTGSVTYVIEDVYNVTSGGTVSNSSSWITSGAGKSFKVPGGTVAGRYLIRLTLTSTGSSSGNTYKADEIEQAVYVNVTAQSNITISFNKNGGTGGQDSVSMLPNCPASQYPTITLPTRGTFRFDGYYSERTGGTQYFNGSGGGANTGPATPTYMYARWYNTVSYSPSNVSAQTSSSSQTLTVSSTGWSCASGETLNSYEIDNIYKDGTSVSATGWSISSNGKTITIPANIATGTYTVRVALQSKSLTTGSSTYYGDDFDTSFTVTVSSPSKITISLNKNGGSGGTTAVSVTPGAAAGTWSVATPPTRTGFTFMGYYSVSDATGGTKYVDVDGTSVHAAPSSSSTIYARWKIDLTWSCYVYDDFTTLSIYCTDKAECASTPSTRRELKISGSGFNCKVTPTVTVLSVYHGNASDYSVSSGGTFLYIPAGTTAGSNFAQVEAEVSNGTYNGYPYVGNSISAFIIKFTMYAVTLSSITADTVYNTVYVNGSATLCVKATYSNGKSKDVGSQSTITFGTSGIASVNNNIAIYIDDYPQDRDDWAQNGSEQGKPNWYSWCESNIFNGTCPEYSGANKYYYTGETLIYSGNSYYLWKYVHVNPTNDLSVIYLLTSTINYTTLYGLSQEYDPDESNYPVVARLNNDRTVTYNTANDQLLLKVDPGA